MSRYLTNEKLDEIERDFKTVLVDREGRALPQGFTEPYIRGMVLKLVADIRSLQDELTKEREAKTKAINSLSYIANKPIGVFGEGFGYKEHYEWLKDDARRSLKSLKKEGNEPNEA